MSSPPDVTAPAGTPSSDAAVQDMLADAVRRFAEHSAAREGRLEAFPAGQTMSATDVAVTVTAMLKAVNMQIFELGMWQAWSGR